MSIEFRNKFSRYWPSTSFTWNSINQAFRPIGPGQVCEEALAVSRLLRVRTVKIVSEDCSCRLHLSQPAIFVFPNCSERQLLDTTESSLNPMEQPTTSPHGARLVWPALQAPSYFNTTRNSTVSNCPSAKLVVEFSRKGSNLTQFPSVGPDRFTQASTRAWSTDGSSITAKCGGPCLLLIEERLPCSSRCSRRGRNLTTTQYSHTWHVLERCPLTFNKVARSVPRHHHLARHSEPRTPATAVWSSVLYTRICREFIPTLALNTTGIRTGDVCMNTAETPQRVQS